MVKAHKQLKGYTNLKTLLVVQVYGLNGKTLEEHGVHTLNTSQRKAIHRGNNLNMIGN